MTMGGAMGIQTGAVEKRVRRELCGVTLMLMPRPYVASADGLLSVLTPRGDILAWQCAMRLLWWHLTITLVRTLFMRG